MEHACNPTPQEVRAGGSQAGGQLGLQSKAMP